MIKLWWVNGNENNNIYLIFKAIENKIKLSQIIENGNKNFEI